MKQINNYITEKFKINSNNVKKYNYHPNDKAELIKLIKELINERGYEANLNDIDTSKIIDMDHIFTYPSTRNFNGDISEWNVSNVERMDSMFSNSNFTGENGDLSDWDVSKVKNMDDMFWACKKLNINIDNWNIRNVKSMKNMFKYTPTKCRPSWYKD